MVAATSWEVEVFVVLIKVHSSLDEGVPICAAPEGVISSKWSPWGGGGGGGREGGKEGGREKGREGGREQLNDRLCHVPCFSVFPYLLVI